MKKIVLSLAVLAGLTFSPQTQASDGFGEKNLKFSTLGDARFQLSFDNSGKRSMLFIKDETGRILYDEAVARNEQYAKVFDFSTLIDGRYTIEINSGKERISRPFEISTSTVRSVTTIAD